MAVDQAAAAPAIEFERIKSVRQVPLEEFFTSGHRTCQGCESATVMRGFVKAAGPRTIATGSTGCMYVANTSYMTTPWIVPWMHTQLGAGGSSAVGTAAGLRALMRKGKIAEEKINVISFCGDLGGGDMGLSGISSALQTNLDLLVILYDNESAANTDIQATGMTTYGAQTTFTPPGKKHRIMQRRWKKNVAGMLAVGHPTCRYVATACASFPPLDFLNKVRKALSVGGPTFIHTFDPCPKGWDYHPRYSHELGELGIRCGIFPLYEVVEGQVVYTYDARKKRVPVREYLIRQGRFAHLAEEDVEYIQQMVDEMWQRWEIPGVAPLRTPSAPRVVDTPEAARAAARGPSARQVQGDAAAGERRAGAQQRQDPEPDRGERVGDRVLRVPRVVEDRNLLPDPVRRRRGTGGPPDLDGTSGRSKHRPWPTGPHLAHGRSAAPPGRRRDRRPPA